MAKIPLQFLPTFQAAAHTQNLRKTAELLHLTHSAVSQQIKVLEEQLGYAVFDRSKRRVRLNAAGEVLLRSVDHALTELHAGAQAAEAVAAGSEQRVRMTVLPSFAHRWLLPRLGRWRLAHPTIVLDIESSLQLADLQKEGYHAGIRTGTGPWPGLMAERLFDREMALIVVGAPAIAQRLPADTPRAILEEPLLGDGGLWDTWAIAAGVTAPARRPVAIFNDWGLMLQAAEQGLGLAIAREILAADAIANGRLVKLSDVAIFHADTQPYFIVFPPNLKDWQPLAKVRQWLVSEVDATLKSPSATS